MLIIVSSAQTLILAGGEHHVALLASTEIAGALLLIWERIQWIGAFVLFVVFASALVMSAMEGEWATRFLQFAASVFMIVMMDGALRRAPG